MVIDPNVDTWNAFKGLQIGQDLEIGKWQLSERQIYTYIHECIMATYNHNLTDPSIAEPQQGPQKWKDLPNDIRLETGGFSNVQKPGNCRMIFYTRNTGPTAGEKTIKIQDYVFYLFQNH